MIFLIIFATMVAMSFLLFQKEENDEKELIELDERRVRKEIEAIKIGGLYIQRRSRSGLELPKKAKVLDVYYNDDKELMVTYLISGTKTIMVDHSLNFVIEYRKY